MGSIQDWQRVKLPENHEAVDLWKTSRRADLWDWAKAWTSNVRDQVTRKPEGSLPALLGYSMGGRLALHALLVAPDLWRGAIIVAAHPGLESEAERQRRCRTDAAWLARFEKEPFADVMADWNAQPVFARETEKVQGPSATAFLPGMERAFGEWSLGGQDSLWGRLEELQMPVWWLCGSEDRKFVELGKRAASLLPNGRYFEAADCLHRVPWEWAGWSDWVAEFERALAS